ncbi:ribonuclease H2, subunit A [Kipferlia bialata]|uniref:Ribonuclease n=1 Tax=Kipferlia bialata TaxID=797122 RepID=A0A9K3CW22_9EUKA|nr:ribonuclease H2, subunit A [Kipferlia bialata]|eukprot:g4479.t1
MSEEGVEYVVGIDEAGRGPVIGPMVYGIGWCRSDITERGELKKAGFVDSKTLTAAKRTVLRDRMDKFDNLHYKTRVLSAKELSRRMMAVTRDSLNAISHQAAVELMHHVVQWCNERKARIKAVYVDQVGPVGQYKGLLEREFPGITFVVEAKADFKYNIVGAASIAAKVHRDHLIEAPVLSEQERGWGGTTSWGSGYPADPLCKAWLADHCDPVFGYPECVRFSWKTVDTALEANEAAEVQYAPQRERVGNDRGYLSTCGLSHSSGI